MNNVIIACDFKNLNELKKFLIYFKNKKLFLKVGYELFYSQGPSVIKLLKKLGHKIFLDLKLHDIPNTVACGITSLVKYNVDFITVHAAGGIAMMKAAKLAAINSKTKILAVTQLTSTDESMLKTELLIDEKMQETVLHYAKNALVAKVDGLISSALEVKSLKKQFKNNFIYITPGIRLSSDQANDQARIVTPNLARINGSDYIVVGRPITKSKDPLITYNQYVKEFK